MTTVQSIQQAQKRIADHIVRTPLVYSATLSRMFDASIFLKMENLQRTGSFKIRGAVNKLIHARQEGTLSTKGVTAASAGNHAQGVAVAAGILNLPCTIVMPHWTSLSKQEAVRNYGGKVVIHGDTLSESLKKAQELADQGWSMIHPYDDAQIIAGQGTVGLEIMDELPLVDMVVAPVGGGGLIAGTALAINSKRPAVQVIGVQSKACPSTKASLSAGRRLIVKATPSIADGISVTQPGKLPFKLIRKYVDGVEIVTEQAITAAILLLLERKKVLAEGAGAVALAACLSGAVRPAKGVHVAIIVSGGNLDSPLLGRIVHRGLLDKGRIGRISVRISDKPGALAKVLHHLAMLNANVLHIHHDRDAIGGFIDEADVVVTIETRSHGHREDILQNLTRAGFDVRTYDGFSNE